MTKQNIKIENRLSTLEANYQNLEGIITEIKDNHLFHLAGDMKELQKSVNNINVKLAMWSGAIIVAIWVMEKFLIK